MKANKHVFSGIAVVLAIVFLTLPLSCQATNMKNRGGQQQAGISSVINQLLMQDLSVEETVSLSQMREEEKLARDVYQTLYQKWGLHIFSKIAQSEQRHMDMVKVLLDKYNLTDPVNDSSVGSFTNHEMLELYNSLVEQGQLSINDALLVGAIIEDLDIKDLYDFLEQTDNEDITQVYGNLARGSRNHLRAFTQQLSLNGLNYESQFLTQEQVDDIISSPHERGIGKAGKKRGRNSYRQ